MAFSTGFEKAAVRDPKRLPALLSKMHEHASKSGKAPMSLVKKVEQRLGQSIRHPKADPKAKHVYMSPHAHIFKGLKGKK